MRNISIALIAVATATIPLSAGRASAASRALHVFNASDLSRVPARSWAPQDPADALWRSGRSAINDSDWQKAAELFHRIRTETAYRNSTYRGQAYYWEAYARTQMGGRSQLRQAADILTRMREDYPEEARSIRDSASLLANVQGRLSREFGDESASATVRDNARDAANCPTGSGDDDDNPRVAALNALLQMDAEAAMPLLEKIVAKRDACSADMRARAMWLIAQKHSPRAADLLIDAVRNDPDPEVRKQAVYWLSQAQGDKAIATLQDVLSTSKDEEVQSSAVFALAQSKDPKAAEILRDYAARRDISSDARGAAIHWLGEMRSPANAAFLRDIFTRLEDEDSRSMVLFAIAQENNAESADFLMKVIMNPKESVDVRKSALYWAANSGEKGSNALSVSKLSSLYDTITDEEMKQQVIFIFSQRHDTASVDKLMSIARNDKNADLRKTAIYWLGQIGSKDPRVAKFLMDLING